MSSGVAKVKGNAFDTFTGDKGFGDNGLLAELERCDVAAVIPPNRKVSIPCDLAITIHQGFAAYIHLGALLLALR